uniref:Zgc:113176 n=1 Tax=Cyprinus carpio TaxID=7962 RepID=A0A8C1WF54_CYPCA
MTRVGSELIPRAASATGLDTSVVENWIGNYKRSQMTNASSEPRPSKAKVHIRELSPYNLFCRDIFKNKGTMNDIKGRWAILGEDAREKYIQEAAALREHGQAQDLSPEIRDARIKMHLKKLKLEVSKLEDLGVETAILSFDRKKSSLEVFELSSKGATDFLDSTDNSSAATPSTRERVSVLVGKVKDLFNQKYKEAGGTGRLPYQSLVNQGLTIKVSGLPNSLTLKKPSFYGRNQLVGILQAADEITFEIECVNLRYKQQSVKTLFHGGNLCCFCRVHFDDKKKNARKKWRSWSQCTVCQSWSHTACGFKKNMCLHCQCQDTMQTP